MNLNLIFRIIFLIFYVFYEINGDENSTNSSVIIKKRTKRYLGFRKGSRFFFRLNVKDNILKVNQIFAHAYGFRANYDILEPERRHKIFRREIYEDLETMINQHGLDGRSCILKTFCVASKEITPETGMLFKLFKMIFTKRTTYETDGSTNSLPDDDAKNYPYLTSSSCEELEKHCPLSLLELSPYTDI